MKFFFAGAVLVMAASILAPLILAQCVIIALNTYHVHSGLTAPWLLIIVAESVIASGTRVSKGKSS